MTALFLFLTSLIASIIGSISGIGGGILIKPIFDTMNLFSINTVNFLSGCTVLTMATVSLLGNKKNLASIEYKTSALIGIGAVLGGVLGNKLFNFSLKMFENEIVLHVIQSICLLLITITVFLFFRFYLVITPKKEKSPILSVIVGISLGSVSSFLGIGGGPLNIACLYYFFLMSGKAATLNSPIIIFVSQLSSLFISIVAHKVPDFDLNILFLMVFGGVLGALIGTKVIHKITDNQVKSFFYYVLIIIAIVNSWNIVRYLL